jgi:NAD(P)-dependent dehydrogenase (short-subunit alcohol dehydrogenase family)
MNTPKGVTEDGFETQFGINHLGYFLLTELLLDLMKKSTPARFVYVSSFAHAGMQRRTAIIDLDDLDLTKKKYHAVASYCQSKLAIVIYARHLAKRLEGTGVSIFSTHPGWIRSNLFKHTMPPLIQNILLRPFSRMLTLMSPEEGEQNRQMADALT